MRDDFATSREDRLTARPLVMGRTGVIAAGHHLATAAGFHILRAGGNAVDAGVAAGVAINVLLYDRTNFAGVAPIIVYHARTDTRVYLDGLGVWPRLADIDEVRRRGVSEGILRSVTPGAPDSWMTALQRFGTMSLGEVLAPAKELAEGGAAVSRQVAADLKTRAQNLEAVDPEARRIFFPGDRAPRVGEKVIQKDLADLFDQLAAEEAAALQDGLSREDAIGRARDYFYRGPVAEKIDQFHRENGGWMRYEDLASHRVEVSAPLHTTYRGYDIYTCGPWCQGPMLLQFLCVLENFDLDDMSPASAEYLHLLTEAMDLVFADRENFYGDPRHLEIPVRGLICKDYAAERAALIDARQAAGRMPDPGNPWRYEPEAETRDVQPVDVDRYRTDTARIKGDTSYVSVVDEQGNIFSATPSDPVFWTPIIPGLGLSCSGRGKQSRTEPDHPSCIAPGKRPRLTPNPALIMRDGEPLMGLGCPGGDAQTQGMLQVFLNMVHFGMNPQEAVEAPRVISRNFPNSFAPHAYYPGRLEAEENIDRQITEDLSRMGHRVHQVQKWAASSSRVHVALKNPCNGTLLSAADPRAEGSATAW